MQDWWSKFKYKQRSLRSQENRTYTGKHKYTRRAYRGSKNISLKNCLDISKSTYNRITKHVLNVILRRCIQETKENY